MPLRNIHNVMSDSTKTKSSMSSRSLTSKSSKLTKTIGGLLRSRSKSVSSVGSFYQPVGNEAKFPKLPQFLLEATARLEKRLENKAKLGTLLGVFLPTIQNVFGVIMFIRLHWIVGMAGLLHTFSIVLICCLITFFTSISLAAIATNGIFEEGGPYFVISRNLSPEFGGAIGILFFLANAVATSMYVVGNVEVLLTYVAPELPQFGDELSRTDEQMANNFRVYGTALLIVMFLIVCAGVRFTQMFAPISLACVIFAIISVFVGAFTTDISHSPEICMVGKKVIRLTALGKNEPLNKSCAKVKNSTLWNEYCVIDKQNVTRCDPYFIAADVHLLKAVPGFSVDLARRNFWPYYLEKGESAPRLTANARLEVSQDITSTYYVLMAIFFPAVTGIMTGCNMSGDLADPQKSIPIGTTAAQLLTSFVFFAFVFFYGFSVERPLLADKYGESLGGRLVSGKLAWPAEWTMIVGVLASTFGAGLQSLFSAARLIQPVAKDELIPFLKPLGKVTKRNEPFRALLVASAIAELSILIGAIDHIAPIVDFFFLMCYCFINIVCVLQTLLRAPNWRPRFRFYHWILSLMGAVLGFFVMFATHWDYALIVLLMCTCIHRYIEIRGARKEWGHGMQGLAITAAHYSLLKIEDKDIHPKNWRPQVQLYLKLETTAVDLLNETSLLLAGMLKGGQGLLMVTAFFKVDSKTKDVLKLVRNQEKIIRESMKTLDIRGFVRVIPCTILHEAIAVNSMGSGIGGLRPNSVMFRWPRRWKLKRRLTSNAYWSFIHAIFCKASEKKCLLIAKGDFPTLKESLTGKIDVWWFVQDGGLLILLPCLLRRHCVWKNCQTRIFAVVDPGENVAIIQQRLEQWVYKLRIDANVQVVVVSTDHLEAYNANREQIIVERLKLAKELGLSWKEQSKEPQFLIDSASHTGRRVSAGNSGSGSETSQRTGSSKTDCTFLDDDIWGKPTRNMQIAMRLNRVIKNISIKSKLVIINLPPAPRHKELMPIFMEYIEAMTDGLSTVLLARGSGKEVITVFS